MSSWQFKWIMSPFHNPMSWPSQVLNFMTHPPNLPGVFCQGVGVYNRTFQVLQSSHCFFLLLLLFRFVSSVSNPSRQRQKSGSTNFRQNNSYKVQVFCWLDSSCNSLIFKFCLRVLLFLSTGMWKSSQFRFRFYYPNHTKLYKVLIKHDIVTKQCEHISSNFTKRVARRMFRLRKKENNRLLNKIA